MKDIPVVKPLEKPEPCIIRRDDIKDIVLAVSELTGFGLAMPSATLGKNGFVSSRRWMYLAPGLSRYSPSTVGNRAHYVATGRWS